MSYISAYTLRKFKNAASENWGFNFMKTLIGLQFAVLTASVNKKE